MNNTGAHVLSQDLSHSPGCCAGPWAPVCFGLTLQGAVLKGPEGGVQALLHLGAWVAGEIEGVLLTLVTSL